MINIVVPMAGKSAFFPAEEYYFPKPLIEVQGKPIIERVVGNLQTLSSEKKFHFVINRQDNANFFLGNTLRLLAGENCTVVEQRGDSAGALCSALLLVDHIQNDLPLIISNSDQIINVDLNLALEFFDAERADAGTIVFNSVHPQWSYVRMDSRGLVTATAEKRPISNKAIAGFYYFRKGADFVSAAFRSILKGTTTNGKYFLSSSFNEMILKSKRICAFSIDTKDYYSFFSPEKVEQFNSGRTW